MDTSAKGLLLLFTIILPMLQYSAVTAEEDYPTTGLWFGFGGHHDDDGTMNKALCDVKCALKCTLGFRVRGLCFARCLALCMATKSPIAVSGCTSSCSAPVIASLDPNDKLSDLGSVEQAEEISWSISSCYAVPLFETDRSKTLSYLHNAKIAEQKYLCSSSGIKYKYH